MSPTDILEWLYRSSACELTDESTLLSRTFDVVNFEPREIVDEVLKHVDPTKLKYEAYMALIRKTMPMRFELSSWDLAVARMHLHLSGDIRLLTSWPVSLYV